MTYIATEPVHDYKKQGKKNRVSGRAFELKVRKDIEKNGFIVCKWSNNVEVRGDGKTKIKDWDANENARLVPAKHKFNPFRKALAMGTGFPDFIVSKFIPDTSYLGLPVFAVEGVEVKSNGTLNKEEKEKCKWLLEHQIFGKIFIASKGVKRGEIVYKEFTPESYASPCKTKDDSQKSRLLPAVHQDVETEAEVLI